MYPRAGPRNAGCARDRAADNWRVLLAIDLGYGEPARRAAVALSANRPDEDPGVTLLADIRIVFQARGGIDRIASAALVEALIGLDDGRWNEWRGPKDDRPPRRRAMRHKPSPRRRRRTGRRTKLTVPGDSGSALVPAPLGPGQL
jgi:hypothetical protein